MGAGQSASNGQGGSSAEVKTSYYELLGVSRQATEEEIKKAYRKKALQLHPDRNFGDEDAATKLFAEIQAAHEVLSDPQERAWYDSHESAILRGEDGTSETPTYENIRLTTADDLARMIRKFNSKVEFSDAPSGFFGFLRETFEQLAREEEIAGSMEGVDVREYPSFGHRDDGYNDGVREFYAAWSGFATVKTYAWMDKYRLSEAPDRWYRRRMEQENQRLRQDGKREFSDAVRSLIAFVKKRDPRYEPNVQTEAERQKTLRDAAAAQAARARAANAAKMEGDVPEWTKLRDPDELEESSEEEVVEEVFECVACDKIFKSERQWEAHEKSKKHQKALRALQAKMRKENKNLDLSQDDLSLDEEGEEENLQAQQDHIAEVNDVDDNDEVLEEIALEHEAEHKKESETGDPEGKPVAEETAVSKTIDPLNQATATPTENQHTSSASSEPASSSSEDEDYAPISTIQARMESSSLLNNETSTPTATSDDEEETKPPIKAPKMGKAAQKRAKKAAAAVAATTGQEELAQRCQICNETFASKTKLFQHIKEEGHAALKSSADAGGKRGKKGKNKR